MAEEKFKEPPLYYLLSPPVRLLGNHTNMAWRAQVARPEDAGPALPMVIKRLPGGQIPVAIELACALAAQVLRLPVPAPALVVADRTDLEPLPPDIKGDRLLLVGSQYKEPDALYARMAAGNAAAEEFIWDRVCASKTGASGAAWDELVANPDRHSENVLFDGAQWWLFDHDLALPKAADYLKHDPSGLNRTEALTFQAKCNELASQMLQRRPGNHGLDSQAKELNKHRTALMVLASYAYKWHSDDITINGIYQVTAILLDKIALRLPSLAQQLNTRMARPDSASLWTSHSQNSTGQD